MDTTVASANGTFPGETEFFLRIVPFSQLGRMAFFARRVEIELSPPRFFFCFFRLSLTKESKTFSFLTVL